MLTQNNGPVRYLRNDGGNRQHWLRVTLKGTGSNRSGIRGHGDRDAGGRGEALGMVKTGSNYLSESELPLTFGLGAEARVAGLECAGRAARWIQSDRSTPIAPSRSSKDEARKSSG